MRVARERAPASGMILNSQTKNVRGLTWLELNSCDGLTRKSNTEEYSGGSEGDGVISDEKRLMKRSEKDTAPPHEG